VAIEVWGRWTLDRKEKGKGIPVFAGKVWD
jgi:hypothetical protein